MSRAEGNEEEGIGRSRGGNGEGEIQKELMEIVRVNDEEMKKERREGKVL